MEYLIVAALVILSGLFSGLTLGMFSLSISSLERKIRMGDKRAIIILPIRQNGSLLLCTLLLGNVAVNSAIAVFLGSIATGVIAGLVATGLIVTLGEILPQAIFTRHALSFSAKTIWILKIFLILLYPVAKPLSLLLDLLLGKEIPPIWSKQEIKEIIRHHEDSPESTIDADEERIVLGALTFSEKKAYDILTPKTVVYYLKEGDVLDSTLLNQIKDRGFSRIPVYKDNPDNMTGILFIKDLIGYDIDDEKSVGELCRKDKMLFIDEEYFLDFVLNTLIKNKVHMAFVYNEFGAFIGIVTLEDIIEEILSVEIVDEADKIEDLQKHARRRIHLR